MKNNDRGLGPVRHSGQPEAGRMKRILSARAAAALSGAALACSTALGALTEGPSPGYLCHIPEEGIEHTLRIALDEGAGGADPGDWIANHAGRCFDTRGSATGAHHFELLVCGGAAGRSLGVQVEIAPTGRPLSRTMGCTSEESP
jgi:hypothetical protein